MTDAYEDVRALILQARELMATLRSVADRLDSAVLPRDRRTTAIRKIIADLGGEATPAQVFREIAWSEPALSYQATFKRIIADRMLVKTRRGRYRLIQETA
jgi:hypothetical protein